MRIPRPLFLCVLLLAACTPPATVGAEAGAGAEAEGGVMLLNASDARQAMDTFYDPLLRDAGVTGRVEVDVTLHADGTVRRWQVESSTHDRFTVSAERVARALRFTPPAAAGAVVRVRMDFVYRQPQIRVVGVMEGTAG